MKWNLKVLKLTQIFSPDNSPMILSVTSSPGTSLSSVYSPSTHPGDVSLPQTPTTPDGDKLIGDPVTIPVFDTDTDGKRFKWGEFKYGKKQSGKVGNNPKAYNKTNIKYSNILYSI